MNESIKRDVARCRHCHLNQFVTASGNCRKCRQSMAPEPVPDVQPVAARLEPGGVVRTIDNFDIGFAVKLVRLANMIGQRELSRRMKCPRSYISKVENGHLIPTVGNIERLAAALNATPYALLTIATAA